MIFIFSIVVTLAVALVGLACYRIYFHHLAHVPGPKLAAVTSWYEFYYECIKNGGGQVAHHLDDLHGRYGPIVRLNPWEVHISDPSFYETLYADPKLDKDPFFWAPFGKNRSTGATVDAQRHRIRRGVIAPCYSMANVRKLEPLILESVQKLLNHLESYREKGKPANFSDAFRCFSSDVANTIALPAPRLQLDDEGFANPLGKGMRAFASLIGWDRHIKIVFAVVIAFPPWLTARLDSTGGTQAVAAFFAMFKENAKIALSRRTDAPKVSEKPLTALDLVVASTHQTESEKSVLRLIDEANNLSAAGTETLGSALSNLTFHLLSNPQILSTLKAELSNAEEKSSANAQDISGQPPLLPLKTLEKLPYLQACINETLRVNPSVAGRSPRINRLHPLTYTSPTGQAYILPAGTTISMSIRDLHRDASAFPNPKLFRPDRWLQSQAGHVENMQRSSFVPFGRGARNCLGSDLAKVEMLLMAGNLFNRVEMELFETGERDVSLAHDWFAPFGPAESEGVRVMVKEVRR